MVSIQHGRLQLPVLRRAGARRAPREVVCLPSGLHGLQTNTTVIVQDYEPVFSTYVKPCAAPRSWNNFAARRARSSPRRSSTQPGGANRQRDVVEHHRL